MFEPKTYELRTIKDIFDLVPDDRWETLFAELLPLFQQAHLMRVLAQEAWDLLGIDDEFTFQEVLRWVDDGKGELTRQLTANDGSGIGFSVKSTLKEKAND